MTPTRMKACQGAVSCLLAFVVVPLLLMTPSCRSEVQTRSLGTEILGDRQAMALDYTFPSYRFDGRGGSLLPTEGWAPAEMGKQPKDTPFFAWALDREASLVFLRPPGSDLHFFARAKPLHWPGAPRQVLAVILNGRQIASIPLAPGWSDYRTAIPPAALVEGLNRIQLKFAFAQRPSEISDSNDDRNLSCAFSDIAVLPAPASDAWALLDIPRFDPVQGIVEMPLFGGFSIPLPAKTQGTLRLGTVVSKCSSCLLTVEVSSGSTMRRLWSGSVAEASNLEISLAAPGGALVSFLGVRLEPPGDALVPPQTKTLIQLPPGYLEIVESPRNAPSNSPPPIFIYMIDTLRADVLEPYGAGQQTSPRISDFSQHAVTYLDAWAPSSWTLPSVASLFTGLFPSRHNMGLAEHKLPGAQVRTLAQFLTAAQYQTLAISHSHVASAAFGLDSGFDKFFLSNHLNGWQLRSQEIRRFLLMLLATADDSRPLFSYLHTVDPHAPYAPRGDDRQFARRTDGQLPEKKYRPMPFILEGLIDNDREVEHLQALYLGEVLFADRQFGLFLDLLDQLSLLDGSLIILLSDHGEEFGEHGGFDHGRTVYEEMLRVPLMIQFPNPEWSGERIHQRVSLLDVLPTILLEADVSDPDIALDGRALRPDLLAVQGPRPVIAETHTKPSAHLGPVDLQALAIDTIKCIHSSSGLDQFSNPMPEWQSFELESDPGESRSLTAEDSTHQRCRRVLANWLEARSAWEGITDADAARVDDKALETLRALGYIN